MSKRKPDPLKVKQMAARVAQGLEPLPQEGELVCGIHGCGRPLDEGAMDGSPSARIHPHKRVHPSCTPVSPSLHRPPSFSVEADTA
jgi:hypothetical protein